MDSDRTKSEICQIQPSTNPTLSRLIAMETQIKQTIYDPFDKIDCSTEVEIDLNTKEVDTETDLLPEKAHKTTEVEILEIEVTQNKYNDEKYVEKRNDILHVPNIIVPKDKIDLPKDSVVPVDCSQSLPSLKTPPLFFFPKKKKKGPQDEVYESDSLVISEATRTYTRQHKINFQVVGNNVENTPYLLTLDYPMNVVSLFQQDSNNQKFSRLQPATNSHHVNKKEKPNVRHMNHSTEINSLSYSLPYDSSKLVKPSNIINIIRANNDLLQSDFICEQFERELNFIDSFFESVQYLESCSVSDKYYPDSNVESLVNSRFDMQNPKYDSLVAKQKSGTNTDNTETISSKSLCLLNLLIRDEQRRVKNLLFVLKIREDALKDFIKSQILWLENKKKLEKTDISVLKKKQRGALLKLQHECGEMQRMRKALVALSEKRKVALMKTKKNIELKFKNNVADDQIILRKKKIKRSTTTDRNIAPLKCFDLSSSGCDENTPLRFDSVVVVGAAAAVSTAIVADAASVAPVVGAAGAAAVADAARAASADKGSRTSDHSGLPQSAPVDRSTDTVAETFVTVDGAFLNILFYHLALPQIFSSGKQYEVNEEALENIVFTTNYNHDSLTEIDALSKFIDQFKNRDLDLSSTPSTARSLLEELDQYYKDLAEDHKTTVQLPDRNAAIFKSCHMELKDESEHRGSSTMQSTLTQRGEVVEAMYKKTCTQVNDATNIEAEDQEGLSTGVQAGPLPVPTGTAASTDPVPTDIVILKSTLFTSEMTLENENSQPLSNLTPLVHNEAEELRLQQLAIEREIKVLEQQHCQLLVVREIPDKPPPPYTLPSELRLSKVPCRFIADNKLDEKVHQLLWHNISVLIEPTDVFDVFIQDFCHETLHKHKLESDDNPWDRCSLISQITEIGDEKLVTNTYAELGDILAGTSQTAISGMYFAFYEPKDKIDIAGT